MKKTLSTFLTAAFLLSTPTIIFGQAPNLGTTANFVVFSTDGAVTNTGISQLTGKVGTNNGSNTGFGNVNGGMHAADGVTSQAATDLLVAYNQLNSTTPGFFPAPLLGNGTTLNAGVYSISAASTLNGTLILDAQNNASAVFIFQIAGPLSTNANSKVKLINGAQACNVFWKVEGLVDMAAGTSMKGTVIANNAGINMNSADTLEGRALSTTGAIQIDGVLAYTPIGCGSPTLTGPIAPSLGEAGCYGIFSADGPVQNAGTTNVIGDVGTNVGLTTGFNALLVTGTIHATPDASTANAAADLLVAYNYVNALPQDIELLYPAQFGGNLVLTPHTYILNGGTTFTDTLYLNAQGVANAVFVIKVEGAFETSTFSNVVLINGTQAKNVYWMVNGAVDINDNSIFNGTIISQGAINLYTGVQINGRALTGVGSLTTNAINSAANIVLGNCNVVSINEINENTSVTIYPNPFTNSTTITLDNMDNFNKVELRLYTILGEEIMSTNITSTSTTINTSKLSSGVYFYKVIGDNQIIKSGKLISQQ
ncbi:MAG: ice-binding family protein [Vicingaceae bacterium]|nr:ice-binding family protein [Vicingaceae bacterium]